MASDSLEDRSEIVYTYSHHNSPVNAEVEFIRIYNEDYPRLLYVVTWLWLTNICHFKYFTTSFNPKLFLLKLRMNITKLTRWRVNVYCSQRDSVTRFSTSGFFHEPVSPKHLSIPIRPFRIFSKIRGDVCGSRCTTGVIDTDGKFATGVVGTSGAPWISPRIFEKIRNYHNIIFRGLWEGDSWKNLK